MQLLYLSYRTWKWPFWAEVTFTYCITTVPLSSKTVVWSDRNRIVSFPLYSTWIRKVTLDIFVSKHWVLPKIYRNTLFEYLWICFHHFRLWYRWTGGLFIDNTSRWMYRIWFKGSVIAYECDIGLITNDNFLCPSKRSSPFMEWPHTHIWWVNRRTVGLKVSDWRWLRTLWTEDPL